MGLYGNDKVRDARLDAIEYYVRLVSDALQQGQLDIATQTVRVTGFSIAMLGAVVDSASDKLKAATGT